MKLQTDIQPRRDGKLTVTTADHSVIVFKKDEAGVLTAEVADAAAQQQLLRTGNFYPVDEQDFKAAESLLADPDADDKDTDDDGDGDDFEGNDDAPLLDANTPPKPPRAKPGPKRQAKP
jgi:hypothetical protein